MNRWLRCTRRQVPLDTVDDYVLAWLALRNAAAESGVRAWLFRRSGHDDHFMEFLEWSGASSPLEDEDMRAAVTQLDVFGTPLGSDEWEEAT